MPAWTGRPLRDWVRRHNAEGIEGLLGDWPASRTLPALRRNSSAENSVRAILNGHRSSILSLSHFPGGKPHTLFTESALIPASVKLLRNSLAGPTLARLLAEELGKAEERTTRWTPLRSASSKRKVNDILDAELPVPVGRDVCCPAVKCCCGLGGRARRSKLRNHWLDGRMPTQSRVAFQLYSTQPQVMFMPFLWCSGHIESASDS